MTLTREEKKAKVAEIDESIEVLRSALGKLETAGWFGQGEKDTPGVEVDITWADGEKGLVCLNGGPICAGIAIRDAAHERNQLRGLPAYAKKAAADHELLTFAELGGLNIDRDGPPFDNVMYWNDARGVTYRKVKGTFKKVLGALLKQRYEVMQ